ncbi:allantoate deiminase/N-carbamoyl-L-amino-acid hydrolase [Noviherbaspirillum humi]|uniref:Allantoate deiminase/N-carbamoyl-L-amino-acid hydrolase n=1 Tax=Noviherbaspirillum humi TaxID=1688639 RepID=A0A239HTU4_9BURK|nr:allantoate amidohydrolase [Noviherbaspirillum humi]SNS84691.1 allantoate deiminase/N-carbamoyl-L-amino-acid hydrolase [Noviherbaspirillum humi]
MSLTLDILNTCDAQAFTEALGGIYEHSPWIPMRAAANRPFRSLDGLKLALQAVVASASDDEKLGLIRAHPELAGKAAIAGELTRESTGEQAKAGLNQCSPEEYARLHELNAAYNQRFGFPFILAVKGPEGNGLTRQQIIATFARRLKNRPVDEMAEALRQIGRIAELRLNDLLGATPAFGNAVMAQARALAAHSDDADGLTCAYLTPAHRQTAAQIAQWMREAGMTATIDAVGNVVGRYAADDASAKTLITGSHYDTVRNGGRYDGRAGILIPIAVVGHLNRQGRRLPFHLEVIAFAEEEGVRYRSTFLGSSAVTGGFDSSLLEHVDADGISLRQALQAAGHDPAQIPGIARDPNQVLAFVELHIEQGPVLLEQNLPVGVVTSIAGSSRYMLELAGSAGHAGTTPMDMRRDAAAAAAEIVLAVEKRCSGIAGLVGTVGILQVPNGSVNVVPGACRLSLDIRAAEDEVRKAAVADVLAEIKTICGWRQVEYALEPILEAAASACAPGLMRRFDAAIEKLGLPLLRLPSGAGHDAMKMAELCDMAMLFIRCGNGGVSHNPLETMTGDDADLAARILLDFLLDFHG